MNLLAGKLYDPAVSVNKATTALLAMTALDTTNLRLTFTVPASGIVRVRMAGVLHGATTVPQIILGVMQGASVMGKQRPMLGGGNVAATSGLQAESAFVVTGLTPSQQLTWDAAYGVETLVAVTGLKYGGPNNTTANDAFGGFAFEIWDVTTQGSGGGGATAQQVWEYATRTLTAGTNIALAKGTGITGFNDLSAAQVNAECDTALSDVGVTSVVTGRIDAAVSTRSTYAGADTAGTTTLLSRLTSPRATALDNLDAAVSTRSTYAGADTSGITTLLGRITAPRAALIDNLDAAVSSRSTYAGADTVGTTALLARLTTGRAAGLDFLDAPMTSRFASDGYTAPDNAGIASIKTQTDKLWFTSTNYLMTDACFVNGVRVTGQGTSGSPWRPA